MRNAVSERSEVMCMANYSFEYVQHMDAPIYIYKYDWSVLYA